MLTIWTHQLVLATCWDLLGVGQVLLCRDITRVGDIAKEEGSTCGVGFHLSCARNPKQGCPGSVRPIL